MTDRSAGARRSDRFAALADPTRRSVLELVAERPRPVGELARSLPVSRPAVSQHLRVLREAGLVVETRQGTRHVYQLHPAGLEDLVAYLRRFWDVALRSFQLVVEQSDTTEHTTKEEQ
jgi:DNA-binding transcriptional ArsR family regulator